MPGEPQYFLLRYSQAGGHVHVDIWAGTAQQADNKARPKLGHLVMDPNQWKQLRLLLHPRGRIATVDIEERTDG